MLAIVLLQFLWIELQLSTLSSKSEDERWRAACSLAWWNVNRKVERRLEVVRAGYRQGRPDSAPTYSAAETDRPFLLKYLDDDRPEVQAFAGWYLGHYDDESTTKERFRWAKRAVRSRFERVRSVAIRTLYSCGEEGRATLFDIARNLVDYPELVDGSSTEVVKYIRYLDYDSEIEIVLHDVLLSANGRPKQEAWSVLMYHETPYLRDLIDAAVEFLESGDSRQVLAALSSLRNNEFVWSDAKVQEAIQTLVAHEERRVREAANSRLWPLDKTPKKWEPTGDCGCPE